MAYFNFKLAESYTLIPKDVLLLQMIYQNKQDNMSIFIEPFSDSFNKLENQGFIKYINGSKKDAPSQLVRLTSKGIDILDTIQIPNINQDDLDIADWVKSIYEKSQKEIGNLKNLKSHVALFRTHSGIERNCLAFLIKSFINDEENFKYSQRADYLIWKPENLFQTKFSLDASKLYQYYNKRKEWFDDKFKNIVN